MLEMATKYAARGWPVLPLAPEAKTPITKHGFKDASTDPDQLREWWHEHPDANIGVATGAAGGIVVIDIDSEAGAAKWDELQELYGPVETLSARSGREHGRHLFFQYPSGKVKTRGKIFDGIDIKADGGYIVVAPSVHPNGRPYRWDAKLPIQPLPHWLLEIVQPPEAQPGPQGPKPELRVVGQTSSYGEAALVGECQAVLDEPEGNRNIRLNEAAYSIGQLVAGGEIAYTDARQGLEANAVAAGLGDVEIIKTMRSGMNAGEKSPRARQQVHAVYQGTPLSASPAPDLPPEVPEHLVRKGQGHLAVEFGIAQIAKDHRVYERGRELVQVSSKSEAQRNINRAEGAASIGPISKNRLWTILSEICIWQRWDARAQTERPTDPPRQVVGSIHDAGDWPGVRHLQGVTTTPILRSNGRLVTAPGYDATTGLYYVSCGLMPVVPDSPSRDDARAALATLYDVVIDFPFGDLTHRDGWMAGLLTPLARALCDCVPLFAFDASTPGTGKTLLADVIGIITGGHLPARTPYVRLDDELRKRIISLALSGDPLVLLDNVPGGGAIGWPSLDSLLTAREINDRVLGESRNVTISNNMTWYCTGNNLSFKADAGRRCLRIRLESNCEHPEERTGFTHDPLKQWVEQYRPQLLGAGLTILAAYLRSGAECTPGLVGSFEQWTAAVAGAITWAGGEDVTELFAARDAFVDPAALAHIQIMEEWLAAGGSGGMTCSDAIRLMADNDSFADAVNEVCGGRKQPTSNLLGYRLRALKGRWRALENGNLARLMTAGKSANIVRWRVETDESETLGETPGGLTNLGYECNS